ncbi:MAG: NADH oxidase [Sphingomonas sp.]|nr:NADH oxidase [Sphingomonas sp.]
MTLPANALELHSLVEGDKLTLSLEQVPIAAPTGDQLVVAMEAAPINPSDLGLLLGPADVSTLEAGGTPDRPVLRFTIPEAAVASVAARSGESMPVGVEGAGTVIAAGPDAQQYMGRTVALFGGSTYATHRVVRASEVLPLPEGTPARAAAAAFVNPLTALSMVETMRMEGHKAIIHTAAASNLGQMLARICRDDGVPLIAVVRSDEQAAILRDLGVRYIADSSKDDFRTTLADACAATDATLAFDAVGGKLTGELVLAMETAQTRGQPYSRYGSARHKQVYVYGLLDRAPVSIPRSVGLAWGVSGYLLPHFLAKAGPEANQRIRERVAAELTTTFASNFTQEISLTQALDPDTLRAYARMATGEKYLIVPQH